MKINKIKRKFKDKLIEKAEIPKEIALNLPKITIIGNTEIYIENVKGVIEYTETQVRINSTIGVINLSGNNFKIIDITTEEIYVSGRIKSLNIMQ